MLKHFITFLRFACQFFGFCLSNIIDDNLSDNSSYEVDYIGLENKIYWVDAETGVYSSTPMWTVSLYSPTEEKLYYALVDCETGDFSFYSQSRGDINL